MKEASMASTLPDQPDLDFERKRAKALLKAARAGDADARARIGAADPALADAQHAIARERGFASWPQLKAHIDAQRPLAEQAVAFLGAVLDGKTGAARTILSARPELAGHDIHTASAAADVGAVAEWIARDPGAATAAHPQTGIAAVVYAAAGRRPGASARCVQMLLDAGADPNAFVPYGDEGDPVPALYYACVADDPESARVLLERGAEVNDGESLHHSAELDHRACLEVLLEFGVDLDSRGGHWNKTVLYFLAQVDGKPGGFAWLLEHGADPDIPSGDVEETPLHRVADSGNTELAEVLIRHGAGLDITRTDGRTAYVIAVRAGNEDIVRRLAEAGASTDGVTARDELLAACQRGDLGAARAVLARSGIRSPFPADDSRELVNAAMHGRTAAVRAMVEVGFDVAHEDPENGTALHAASWWGRVDTVRALLEAGAPIDAVEGRFGGTPIGWAAHGSRNCRSADADYIAVVDALIEAGADQASAVNRDGLAPSDAASKAVAAHLAERGY
jgi:ankyrin repeat protein